MGTISQLNELTAPANNDLVVVRDASDASDKDKKMQLSTLGKLAMTWTARQTISPSTGDAELNIQVNETDQFARAVFQDGVVSIQIVQHGSAYAGTLFGLPRASQATIFANGSTISALVIGTVHNVPLVFGTNSAERMRIASDGKITMPVVYSTTVGATNRDLFIDSTGLIGFVSSTRRDKEDIQPLVDLDWLYLLRPVRFVRKGDPAKTPEMGLVAEEVAEVAPYLVSRDEQGDPETVRYSQLIPALLAAVQQQQEQVRQLFRRIEVLEERLGEAQ